MVEFDTERGQKLTFESRSVYLLVLVAQWIERSPPKRQVARSIRAEDEFFYFFYTKIRTFHYKRIITYFFNSKNPSGGGQ